MAVINVIQDLEQKTREAITVAQASGALPEFEIPQVKVSRAARAELGDYATPVAMQLAKPARKSPAEIAEAIEKDFPSAEYLATVEATAGYLNFRLSSSWLQSQLDTILTLGDKFGFSEVFAGKKAQVECVSANPTGPITVGRIRGGVIGDTLARLLKAVGYNVELEYYYNDAGAQIDKLAESVRARCLERLGKPVKFPEKGYEGTYIFDIADAFIAENAVDKVASDDLSVYSKFAINIIQQAQRKSLARVGIVFDSYFSEQTVYTDGSIDRVLAALREKDLVYEALVPERDSDYDAPPEQEDRDAAADGPASWLRMRRLRSSKKDVALVRSNGEPTYRLPDIAYHVNKLERGFDLAVNILGADHIEEAKDIKAAVAGLGYDADKIHAIIHQFVLLIQRKKADATEKSDPNPDQVDEEKITKDKMSTRRGEFVTLDELVEDVGADATRYFILARSPDSHMDFDLDLARKQSSENPVFYIQNAHVRCESMLRTAQERGLKLPEADVTLLTDERELKLIRKLLELPEIVQKAVDELAPHRLAFWAHEELAGVFHPTYEEIRAIHDTVSPELASARLKLYAAAKVVLRQTLSLMGMSAPDKM